MYYLKTWFQAPIHTSFQIMWLSLAIIFGVIISNYIGQYFLNFSWLIFATILLVFCFIKAKRWVVFLIIISGLTFGLWRGGNLLNELSVYRKIVGKTTIVSVSVAEDVVSGKRGDKQVVLKDIKIDKQKIPGKIWISLLTKNKIKRSDEIKVEGIIKNGFGPYAASINSASLKQIYIGSDAARDARDKFAMRVREGIKEPESSLGIGFLVGQRSTLPEDFDQALRVAGLTHIIVASGYNLTVLLRLSKRLFEKISKYLTALSSGGLIIGFIFVTGLSPSMSRAGLVAGLSLLAWYYGRKFNPFVLLSFVAGVSVIANPNYIWGDVGWYLSFAAFLGVMIISPLLNNYFFGPEKPKFFRQIIFETVSALIMTIPIVLLIFQQYSTYALLANILVVPLIPVVMLLVFIAGIITSFGVVAHVILW
jgi:competence protein ComEC